MKPFIIIRAIQLPALPDLQTVVDNEATSLRPDYRLAAAYPEVGPNGPRLILIFQR